MFDCDSRCDNEYTATRTLTHSITHTHTWAHKYCVAGVWCRFFVVSRFIFDSIPIFVLWLSWFHMNLFDWPCSMSDGGYLGCCFGSAFVLCFSCVCVFLFFFSLVLWMHIVFHRAWSYRGLYALCPFCCLFLLSFTQILTNKSKCSIVCNTYNANTEPNWRVCSDVSVFLLVFFYIRIVSSSLSVYLYAFLLNGIVVERWRAMEIGKDFGRFVRSPFIVSSSSIVAYRTLCDCQCMRYTRFVWVCVWMCLWASLYHLNGLYMYVKCI